MYEIKVLSDEEFYQMKKQDEREKFLKELNKLSKASSNTGFSIKDTKIKKTEEKKEEIEDDDSISAFVANSKTDNGEWDDFVAELVNPMETSPIESVTDNNIVGFQLDLNEVSDNKYANYFKAERAMLSEILKGMKAHSSRINSMIKQLNINRKGSGVTKGITDILEVYTSTADAQARIIKNMTDLKTKEMEWNLKEKANQPANTESTDNIADLYYKRIINGGTKNFIQNALGGQSYASDFEYDTIEGEQTSAYNESQDPSQIDSMMISTGFNITQPLNAANTMNNSYGDMVGDEYGYIANENKEYDICVYQYGEGRYEFVALDEDGVQVPGVELPSDTNPEILDSLTIRPGSNYVYDKYGRKYRVIEQNGVDISDIDDMDYPFGSDEEK